MKKIIYFGVLFVLLTLGACSDDDGSDLESVIPTGTGSMEVMSAEDQLKYVQETVGMAFQLFNPEDQKELLLNGAFAVAAYGELKAPAEWRALADELVKAATVTVTGNGSLDTRASYNVVNSVYFSDFTGQFTPGEGEWVKTGSSDKIEFLFSGPDGQQQTFVITGSKETFLYSFVSEQWKGTDVYYISTAIYIPTTLEVSYNVHGQSLAKATINYSVTSKENGSYDIKAAITADAANLNLSINLSANDNLLTGDFKLNVSGTQLLNGVIAADGHDLTNLQHIMLLTSTEDVVMLIDDIESYMDILGRVQINSEAETSRKFFRLRTGGQLTLEEADKEAKKLVNLLDDKTETWIRFNGTKTKQSEIHWAPYSFELSEGWGYAVTPLLYFPKEKLTVTPEEILSMEMISALTGLIDRYKSIFTPSGQN